jgi:hypothetical protein
MRVNCQDCVNNEATQLHPYPLCSRCWTSRYGTNHIGGEDIPFLDLHRARLEGLDLWKRDDESATDWGLRCKKYSLKLERRLL